MDVTKIGDKSIRIKSKNASFIINPEKKIEDEIIVLTQKPNDYSQFGENIVISGPGEYESSGVSIKGDSSDRGILYDFFEEGQRLIVSPAPQAVVSRDMEDVTAVVTYINEGDTEALSKISANVVAVIGDDSLLPAEKDTIKKTDKINLKKTEEYKGFLVHLAK